MRLRVRSPFYKICYVNPRECKPQAQRDAIGGKAPKGKFTETIADAVEVAKENKEMKVEYMTYYMELRRSEERGMEKGREEGRKEGRMEGRMEALKSLVASKLLSLKDAAAAAGMSEEKFKEFADL
ncbi:hypothetical protein [Selenomonas sp.]|jgi:flagellar biosynthesis/type III secretory pathway protein FliH|uniref:hypothetical protein n=1 Tax=Selenomonas sp. TaxID=2053611 RepID=UPI003A10054B